MMRGLAIVLVALLVVGAVCVGAYNVFTGANNKPMPLYDVIKEFSKLNLNFDITTDTYERMIEHFDRFKDDTYKFTTEYMQGSALYRLWKDWYNNSFVSYVLVGLSDFIYLALSMIFDALIVVFRIIVFSYKLLSGVPSTQP